MRLAQYILRHLAGGGQGEGAGERHALRAFVVGQQRAAELPQAVFVGACSGPQYHDRMYCLAPDFAWHADDAAGGYGRMLGQRVLHLGAVDVFATGHDHVLQPVHHGQVTMLIELSAVARMQPACAQGLRGFFRAHPVAGRDHRAAQHDFSDLAGRHVDAMFVHHAQLATGAGGAGRGGAAAGPILGSVVPRTAQGGNRARLRHAVELVQADPRNQLLDPLQQGPGAGRSAIAQPPHRAQALRMKCRMVQHHLKHARDQAQVRYAFTLDQVQRQVGAKLGHDHAAAARKQVRQCAAECGNVEHGCGNQADAVVQRRVVGQAAHGAAPQILVAEHHTLGAAGRASGVEQGGNVVRAEAAIDDRCVTGDKCTHRQIPRRGRLPGMDDALQKRRLLAELRHHRGVVLVHEQNRGRAVFERCRDLWQAPARVDRADNRAYPPARQPQFHACRGIE